MRKAILVGVIVLSLIGAGGVAVFAASVQGGPTPSVTVVTTPGDVSGLGAAPGNTATSSTQTIAVRSNVNYDVEVQANKAKLTKYNTSTSTYTDSVVLTNSLTVQLTEGVGAVSASTVQTDVVTNHAKATEAGGNSHTITLSQTMDWNDEVLTSPETYKVELTWTASAS